MKLIKLIVPILILLAMSTFAYAFLDNPFSVLDVSSLEDVDITINITNKEAFFNEYCPVSLPDPSILALNSMKQTIVWNIFEAEEKIYSYTVYQGNDINPIGGTIQ